MLMNHLRIFLVLGEGRTDDTLVLILGKQRQNFAEFFISIIISYLFVSGKEIYKYKADVKMLNFQPNFALGAYLKT